MKKFASISIDLRQSNLVRISDETSMKLKTNIKPKLNNESTEECIKNKIMDCHISKKSTPILEHNNSEATCENDNNDEDASTTVIHLKMVSPNKEEDLNESKNIFQENSKRENKISDVKKLMKDINKDKINECKKNENKLIRDFEINRQLERLKSETKKNVRKSYLSSQTSISQKECLKNQNESPAIQQHSNNKSNNYQNKNKSLLNDNINSSFNVKKVENTLKPHTLLLKDEYVYNPVGNKLNNKLKKEKDTPKSQLKIDQIDQIISHLTANDMMDSLKSNSKNEDKIQNNSDSNLNYIKNNFTNSTETQDVVSNVDSDDDKTDTEQNSHDTITKTDRKLSWLKGPASYKRRCLSSKGPLSKRRKLWSDHGMEVDDRCMLSAEGLKWLVVQVPAQQHYHQGHHIFKDLTGLGNLMETLRVCVSKVNGDDNDEGEDEDEKYNQIGKEVLKLGNLSEEDINELKKQVKEEQHHKENENIMPILLNMSWEQIESSYNRNNNGNDNYLPDITSPQSDEDEITKLDDKEEKTDTELKSDEDDDEEEEEEEVEKEEEEDVEFKSLDALYQEEFSKSGYKKLLNQLENDPYQLDEKNNFWQDNNYDYKRLKDGVYYDNEPVTDYSRSRPKRASVDYTPSAFTVIRYMEGGRPDRKPMSRRKGRGDVGGAVSSNESVVSEEERRQSNRVVEKEVDKDVESLSDDDGLIHNGRNGHKDSLSDSNHQTDRGCDDLNTNNLIARRIKEKPLIESSNDETENDQSDDDDKDTTLVSVKDHKSVFDVPQDPSNDSNKFSMTSFKYDDDDEEVDDEDDGDDDTEET